MIFKRYNSITLIHKFIFNLVVLSLLTVGLASKSNGQTVSLTGVQPESGLPDKNVQIFGSGFDTGMDPMNTVTFIPVNGTSGTQASILTQTGNALEVTVPGGLSPGNYRIEVDNSTTKDTTTAVFQVLKQGGGKFIELNTTLKNVTNSSIDWADFDSDGDKDPLIFGMDSNNNPTTKLYENNGDSTFSVVTTAGLTDVAMGDSDWGDIDRDGDLDLIITGGDTNQQPTATVYENQGGGSFAALSTPAITPVMLSSNKWVDIDGDGDLDLVIAGAESQSSVSTKLYENDGNGSFSAVANPFQGVQNGDLDWADYDSDGDEDLFVTGQDTTGMSSPSNASSTLYQNDGAGNFSVVSATNIGNFLNSSVDWGDFNSDGLPDLLITGFEAATGPKARVYKNNGSGKFQNIFGINKPIVGDAKWGEFDGDGNLDILISGDVSGPETQILRNQNNVFFGSISAPIPDLKAGAVSWVDFNGDGFLDALYTGENSNGDPKTVLLQNTPPPFKVSDVARQAGTPGSTISVTGTGFNKTPSTNTFSFINQNTGSSVSSSATSVINGQLFTKVPKSLPAGNYGISVNNGLKSDTTARIFQVVNSIGGAFTQNGSLLEGGSRGSISWADYDNDGDMDFIVTGFNANNSGEVTFLYTNDGTGNFTRTSPNIINVQASTTSWGDFDNDGDLDLFISGQRPNGDFASRIYQNNNGSFSSITANIPNLKFASSDWGDFDNDGDLDLAVSGLKEDGPASQITDIYRNDGNGNFTALGANLTNVDDGDLDWGDFNSDGHLDLMVLGSNSSNRLTFDIYLNEFQTKGSFTSISNPVSNLLSGVIGSPDGGSVEWGDYDNDGDLDFLITGDSPVPTDIYRNDGAGTFTAINAGLTSILKGSASWGDIDADGDLDLALSGSITTNEHVAEIYRNEGNDIFNNIGADIPGLDFSDMAFVDFNQDGLIDLSITGEEEFIVDDFDFDDRVALFQNKFGTNVKDSAGFRLLSMPIKEGTYSDLLNPVWTQGVPGSDGPQATGAPSVLRWDHATDGWKAINSMSDKPGLGNGFLTFLFEDDDGTTTTVDGRFPKTLPVDGEVNRSAVSPTMNTEAGAFTLVGNPFASTIDFDNLGMADLTGVAYVWNPIQASWQQWNGTMGNLTDGLISPFQGFFVENTGSPTSPNLEFTTAAIENTKDAPLRGKSVADNHMLILELTRKDMKSDAWIGFNKKGDITERAPGDALALTELSDRYIQLATAKKVDSKLYSINNIPKSFSSTQPIPLYINAGQTGSYTLKAEKLALPEGVNLYFRGNNGVKEQITAEFGKTVEITEDQLSKSDGTPATASKRPTISAQQKQETQYRIVIEPVVATSNPDEQSDLPNKVNLNQNYPNPFNPSTQIQFELPSRMQVSLKVYDVMGREVATLVNETRSAGRYSATFNASNLASGVYIYRLQTAENVLTRKMVLIK